jgi:hypothetical protein
MCVLCAGAQYVYAFFIIRVDLQGCYSGPGVCVLCVVCCVVCGVWCVLCMVCCVLCVVWCVVCGVCCVLCVVYGVLCVVCCVVCGVCCVLCVVFGKLEKRGVWCVLCAVCCVLCGVWCVVCGVRCVLCVVSVNLKTMSPPVRNVCRDWLGTLTGARQHEKLKIRGRKKGPWMGGISGNQDWIRRSKHHEQG